jgi:hypothetical protein
MKEHHLELVSDAMFSDEEELVNRYLSTFAREAARAAAAVAANDDDDNDNDE